MPDGMTTPENPGDKYRKELGDNYNRDRYKDNGYRLPPSVILNSCVESGEIIDSKELLNTYKKNSVDLLGPIKALQKDARTRFETNDYSSIRSDEILEGMNRDFEQAVIHVDKFEDLGGPEISYFAKILNEDLVRVGAFHKLEKHALGFKFFYFDSKGSFSLLATGRRHGAINTQDWMSMFSPLKGLEPSEKELEFLSTKENKQSKLLIPENEKVGKEVSKMVAHIDHFERAVGAMNRYNAFKSSGQEMFMEISGPEQELLGNLFTVENRAVSDNKKYEEFEEAKTKKITVTVKENGVDVDKKFYTNLLSYYITADPEIDRRRYEATMIALAENDIFSSLKTLPLVLDHFNEEEFNQLRSLFDKVKETREDILNKWDSASKPFRRRLAEFAYEQNFNIQTGTQNIAELAYRFKWKKVNNRWDYTVEIPGPEVGQDAVNGRSPLVHELTYKVLKGRGVTNLMPWPKTESVNEMIKIALMETRGKDPKPIILRDPGLAKGAAIIGLYPNEAEDKLSEKDLKDVNYARGKLTFNEEALRVLDKILWIYDLSTDGCYLPMPIKPMYDSFNLYKVMKDSVTNETVHETLSKEGKTLQDVDFNNMIWYTGDAWEVNMKMMEDVLQMMYGRQDPKYVDTFLQDKVGGIGEMIKKMDIGTRAEKWEVEVRKSLDPENSLYNEKETIDVPKGFIEIMQISYLIVTHTALKKWRIWDEGGWGEDTQRNYWEDIQDWAKVASYEPSEKGKFNNYSDTLVLMIYALAEWYVNPAKKYNDEANNLNYLYDRLIPSEPEKYTKPTIKSDKN